MSTSECKKLQLGKNLAEIQPIDGITKEDATLVHPLFWPEVSMFSLGN